MGWGSEGPYTMGTSLIRPMWSRPTDKTKLAQLFFATHNPNNPALSQLSTSVKIMPPQSPSAPHPLSSLSSVKIMPPQPPSAPHPTSAASIDTTSAATMSATSNKFATTTVEATFKQPSETLAYFKEMESKINVFTRRSKKGLISDINEASSDVFTRTSQRMKISATPTTQVDEPIEKTGNLLEIDNIAIRRSPRREVVLPLKLLDAPSKTADTIIHSLKHPHKRKADSNEVATSQNLQKKQKNDAEIEKEKQQKKYNNKDKDQKEKAHKPDSNEVATAQNLQEKQKNDAVIEKEKEQKKHNEKEKEQKKDKDQKEKAHNKEKHAALKVNTEKRDKQKANAEKEKEKENVKENKKNKLRETSQKNKRAGEKENKEPAPKKGKKRVVDEKKKPNLKTRMSPSHISTVVENLTEEQRQDVRDIGFGGLLSLNIKHNKNELTRFLVEKFDVYKCSIILQNGEMDINEDDVVSVFDLPKGHLPVKESNGLKKKDNEEGFTEFLKNWRDKWGETTGGPSSQDMCDRLSKSQESGDDFKRDFVVLVVSTLLKGKQDNYVNYNVLYSLRNVNQIRELDWCNYTIKSLVYAAEKWMGGRSYFIGPVTLLLLCYLDRVVFKVRSVPRQFPVCSNWDSDKIKDRIEAEKDDGEFGIGKIWKRFPKPAKTQQQVAPQNAPRALPEVILSHSPAHPEVIPSHAHHDAPDILPKPQAQCGSQSESATDNTDLTLAIGRMADAVIDCLHVLRKTGKEECMAGIFKKALVNHMIQEEHELQIPKEQTQDDIPVGQQDALQPSPPKKYTVTIETLDDDYFLNPAVMMAIEKIEQAFIKKQKNPDFPSFSLGIPGVDTDESQEAQILGGIDVEGPSDEPKSTGGKDAKNSEEAKILGGIGFKKPRSPNAERPSDENAEEYIVKSTRGLNETKFQELLNESEDDSDDVMIRKTNIRRFRNLPTNLRSPFWKRTVTDVNNISKKEQLISDYALLPTTDKNKGEVLFTGKGMYGFREDFQTLTPNKWVVSNIIDIWSLKLSLDNIRRSPEQLKRVFFSSTLTRVMARSKDISNREKDFGTGIDSELANLGNLDLEDADLVFFPIIKNSHFWVICFNFNNDSMEIMDNKPLLPGYTVHDTYGVVCEQVNLNFADYLEKKKLKLNKKVANYKMIMLKMKWREKSNYNDCGIYCMRHMETYKGKGDDWESGFKKNKDTDFINVLRIKYCSSIIMMDTNEKKHEVMKRARENSTVDDDKVK